MTFFGQAPPQADEEVRSALARRGYQPHQIADVMARFAEQIELNARADQLMRMAALDAAAREPKGYSTEQVLIRAREYLHFLRGDHT